MIDMSKSFGQASILYGNHYANFSCSFLCCKSLSRLNQPKCLFVAFCEGSIIWYTNIRSTAECMLS